MSGVFQRPDFSQDYPPQEYQQPAPVAVGYGYEDQSAYNYADPSAVPYPVQPYGAQYGQQEYHSGEYPAYQQEDPYAQQGQQGQHPSHQPHPGQQAQPEASGFFDTGMIDVRQFRDDPYQR